MITKMALPVDVLCTEFGGTLLRRINGWEWIDGTPEPDVHDITLLDESCEPLRVGNNRIILPYDWKEDEYWPVIGEDLFASQEGRDEICRLVEHLISNDPCVGATMEGWVIPRSLWWCTLGIITGMGYKCIEEKRIKNKARSLGWSGD